MRPVLEMADSHKQPGIVYFEAYNSARQLLLKALNSCLEDYKTAVLEANKALIKYKQYKKFPVGQQKSSIVALAKSTWIKASDNVIAKRYSYKSAQHTYDCFCANVKDSKNLDVIF